MKLFATDLDGTLLDRADGIHPRDLAAIRRARDEGVVVTIATGRLTSRTHPIARQLELDAPLVCADGGVLACASTERILAQRAVAPAVVDALLERFARAGLSSFVFTHDAIHSCERGALYHPYVRGWSHVITTHGDVRRAPVLDGASVIMVVSIGAPSAIERVREQLADETRELEVFAFDLGEARVLRIMARGATKGAALAELAHSLGVAPEHVAVIGDWHNDLSMFEMAGCSFAMPHAPDELKSIASCVLDDEAHEQGPIAHALERWLADF